MQSIRTESIKVKKGQTRGAGYRKGGRDNQSKRKISWERTPIRMRIAGPKHEVAINTSWRRGDTTPQGARRRHKR